MQTAFGVLATALVLILPARTGFAAEAAGETLRVAYGQMPPMVYQDRHGGLHGFAYDVLNEAARREGIRLDWRRGSDLAANDRALAAGYLDLVVTGLATPERRTRFYVSEPWWLADIVAVVRSDSRIHSRSDVADARVAVPGSAVLVKTDFPSITLVHRRSAPEAAEAVCTGEADAAMFASMYLPELLAAGRWGCEGVSLRTFDTGARIEFVIVARNRIAARARALRRHIDDLTADGTLAAIAARHPPVSAPQATRLEELLRIRYERRAWRILMGAVSAVLLLGAVFFIRQRRAQRELRRSHAALLESEQRFRRIIAEAPLPVILHAEDGEILQTSRAWAEITGYEPGEVRTIADWTRKAYGERAKEVHAHIQTFCRRNWGEHAEGEQVIRTARGEERVWYFGSAPVGEDDRGRRLVVSMAADITDLKRAQEQVRVLSGLLPICASCKQIRDPHGRWHPLERFIHDNSEAQFSHSLCPACLPKYAPSGLDIPEPRP